MLLAGVTSYCAPDSSCEKRLLDAQILRVSATLRNTPADCPAPRTYGPALPSRIGGSGPFDLDRDRRSAAAPAPRLHRVPGPALSGCVCRSLRTARSARAWPAGSPLAIGRVRTPTPLPGEAGRKVETTRQAQMQAHALERYWARDGAPRSPTARNAAGHSRSASRRSNRFIIPASR